MNDQEKHELIEKYWDDQLNPDQRSWLEQKMSSDPAFKQEVHLHKALEQFFKDPAEMKLRETLATVVQDKDKKGKQANLFPRIWQVAAVIAILLAVFVVYWQTQKAGPDSEQLFIAFYQPYPMVLNQRGVSMDNTDLQAAINAYTSGDYATASDFFEKITQQDSLVNLALFYQGISHLSLDQPDQAIQSFKELIGRDPAQLKPQTLWYLGLTYLVKQDQEMALTTFQQLDYLHNYKVEEVQQLLDELKGDQ
ncbi:MAG: tetratricopeptide repeat protein [Candidatus Cyclobacteriaceae bacterium M3_2C_046]